MTMTSCELTIFEGPDGGGKSTAAEAYANATGARYVHFGSFTGVTGASLPRLYLEAMLPALHGYQPVVLDRCWLSEEPYGDVFRPTKTLRVTRPQMRMLERVTMRCAAKVVYCLPPVETCLATFRSRKGEEMLNKEDELVAVYDGYRHQLKARLSQLPHLVHDRTKNGAYDLVNELLATHDPALLHPLGAETVGNRQASVCLVGENYALHKDADALQQYPFTSMSRQGCSYWLAEYLASERISETSLCWVNADQLELAPWLADKDFIALGAAAAQKLDEIGMPYKLISHPQYQKRFKSHGDYKLARTIRELTTDVRVAEAA